MRFSVVIPALNEEASIGRAIRSAWEAGAQEVLVADGGSDDGTAELASKEARVIAASRGRASQQNAGAAAATGEVLLFLHADAALAPQAGVQLANAFASSRVGCCAFRQRIEAPGLAYRWLERGNAQRVRWLGLPYGDQAICIRRQVFEQIGGFPAVPLLEDLILMQRLRHRCWPRLLEGPVSVSPRRWQKHGIVKQTLRNWGILLRYSLGVPPEQLAGRYRRHDQ